MVMEVVRHSVFAPFALCVKITISELDATVFDLSFGFRYSAFGLLHEKVQTVFGQFSSKHFDAVAPRRGRDGVGPEHCTLYRAIRVIPVVTPDLRAEGLGENDDLAGRGHSRIGFSPATNLLRVRGPEFVLIGVDSWLTPFAPLPP